MKAMVSERGQVVIPKKIREMVQIAKGDELEIDVEKEAIILRPIRRFKARQWRDYAGIAEGIVDSHLRERKKEKTDEDVCP